ncbi:hypothetical protein [Corynebacterium liangguodongii]|uniref:Uncharacterized protein n=1 Tax=Corynebacterium liangguodongii TaxID=2079535 RepID=A0A2S0WEB8_9CORY|nr:hypothetical protein [Corynebacterium liangguodongii]AWB84109.1 hypothetical protein C3E79_06130 [Corynebacterium liangguodongii]PWC00120.1 hypothetical protein DF219_02770 [Corynebacterium liangguodongii]
MSTPNRAVAFLAAFNTIEKHLRSALGAKRGDGFTWMVGKARRAGILTQRQGDVLTEFAELRNAISHGEYEDFRPIAEPLPETVAEIERIRDALLRPTAALSVTAGEAVSTFAPGDAISGPLALIRDKDFSQFPIYEGNRCVGVLTTDAIARWVAADLGADGTLDARTVAEVLRYGERVERAVFLSRDATVAAAYNALTTPLDDASLPRILIITESGVATGRPLGVLTAADLPALVRHIKRQRTAPE